MRHTFLQLMGKDSEQVERIDWIRPAFWVI